MKSKTLRNAGIGSAAIVTIVSLILGVILIIIGSLINKSKTENKVLKALAAIMIVLGIFCLIVFFIMIIVWIVVGIYASRTGVFIYTFDFGDLFSSLFNMININ